MKTEEEISNWILQESKPEVDSRTKISDNKERHRRCRRNASIHLQCHLLVNFHPHPHPHSVAHFWTLPVETDVVFKPRIMVINSPQYSFIYAPLKDRAIRGYFLCVL